MRCRIIGHDYYIKPREEVVNVEVAKLVIAIVALIVQLVSLWLTWRNRDKK